MNTQGTARWMHRVCRWFCQIWHRLDAPLPDLPDGPCILAGNHRSTLDPILLVACVSRPVCFLMSRDYVDKMWYARWILSMAGIVSVRPGGANRQALGQAMDVLHKGGVICLFPEGGANKPVPMKKLLPGAAVLSLETSAPIIPFRISGVWPYDHQRFWVPILKRGRARVIFGPYTPGGELKDRPITREHIDDMTAELQRGIKSLR